MIDSHFHSSITLARGIILMSISAHCLTTDQLQSLSFELRQEHPSFKRLNSNTLNPIFGLETRKPFYMFWMRERKEDRLLRIINCVQASFEHLEKQGVKIVSPQATVDEKSEYLEPYYIHNNIVESIALIYAKVEKPSSRLTHEFTKLKIHAIALKCHLNEALAKPDANSFQTLKELAEDWKKNLQHSMNKESLTPAEIEFQKASKYPKWNTALPYATKKGLNVLEIKQLEEAAKHPEWVAAIKTNPEYLELFFKWALRDYNPVKPFILYPNTTKKIYESRLSAVLGYSRDPQKETLRIEEISTDNPLISRRILTLPIYSGRFDEFEPHKQKRYNILNPDEMLYFGAGNYYLTVNEFFKSWYLKNYEETNTVLCANWGFSNFHPVEGVWDSKAQNYPSKPYETLPREGWIYKMPVCKVISKEAMARTYGDKIANLDFFFKAGVTAKEKYPMVLECHTFWKLYYRNKNKDWHEISPGVYADRYIQGIMDKVLMLCDTVKSVLSLYDQNFYNTNRQRAFFPFFPDHELKTTYLNYMFDRILRRNRVFQFVGKNCAYYVKKSIEKTLISTINLFQMPFVEGITHMSFFDRFFQLLKHTHIRCQNIGLTILHLVLGSWRSCLIKNPSKEDSNQMTEKRHALSHFFYGTSLESYQVYNPTLMIEQINQGILKEGELFGTNTEEHLHYYDKQGTL